MHISPGRLRIRSLRVRGNNALALGIVAKLQHVSGVLNSKVNTTTGSIVVTHDVKSVSAYGLINFLILHQWVDNVIPFPNNALSPRLPQACPERRKSSTKMTSPLANKYAIRLLKLFIPVLTERYLGKSAGKIVAALI